MDTSKKCVNQEYGQNVFNSDLIIEEIVIENNELFATDKNNVVAQSATGMSWLVIDSTDEIM